MAHRNRWFTYWKWWIFPVRYVKQPDGNTKSEPNLQPELKRLWFFSTHDPHRPGNRKTSKLNLPRSIPFLSTARDHWAYHEFSGRHFKKMETKQHKCSDFWQLKGPKELFGQERSWFQKIEIDLSSNFISNLTSNFIVSYSFYFYILSCSYHL